MIRDIFLGFVKVHILHDAAKEPVYGLWLIEELGHHGYSLSPGTLYPTLHKLEQKGLLKLSRKNVGGRIRKYYRTTARGKRVLSEAREKIAFLVEEVMRGVRERIGRCLRFVRYRTEYFDQGRRRRLWEED